LVLVDDVIAILEDVECDWCTQCEAVCATGAIGCPFEIVFE
jgi:ferredoxin